MSERDSLASKLPITLITGFLGSGKTTLISKLLRHPGMNRAAVIINEVGEIGIDHDLVANVNENMSLLASAVRCAPICKTACGNCSLSAGQDKFPSSIGSSSKPPAWPTRLRWCRPWSATP
jgi:Ni2+-binding GTPase involved in maturation of urease and hydrogenase